MIDIGKYNTLKVNRIVDFGVYLTSDDENDPTEVLLPVKYVPENVAEGQEIKVFVYRDSEDRLIATTEKPFATVGEFAFLQVRDVTRVGAFLDWGLVKDLLCPFREQKVSMRPRGVYLVYVYLDNATQRVVASAKIDKFLGNVMPKYRRGDTVKALVYGHEPGLGYRCIVDNLHKGMIYENQVFAPLEIEQVIDAKVSAVREDGKIDLTPGGAMGDRAQDLAERILYAADQALDKRLMMSDKSSPEEIKRRFGCSKKDFKRAIGMLYHAHAITLGDGFIQAAE